MGRQINLLNTQQYLEMRREAYYNDSIADPRQLSGAETKFLPQSTFMGYDKLYGLAERIVRGTRHKYHC